MRSSCHIFGLASNETVAFVTEFLSFGANDDVDDTIVNNGISCYALLTSRGCRGRAKRNLCYPKSSRVYLLIDRPCDIFYHIVLTSYLIL